MNKENPLRQLLLNSTFWEELDTEDIYAEHVPEFSKRFKRSMNRLFREQLGADHALHPEVDNLYERIRSKIVRIWLNFYFKK